MKRKNKWLYPNKTLNTCRIQQSDGNLFLPRSLRIILKERVKTFYLVIIYIESNFNIARCVYKSVESKSDMLNDFIFVVIKCCINLPSRCLFQNIKILPNNEGAALLRF